MPSDFIIVESSGTPLLEQVMVFVIKTIGKSTSEITSILSSLPSAAMGGSVAIAEDASAAWMKGLNGTWGKIGSESGGLPAGGTVGQYIKKLSAAYGDAAWETPDTTPTLNSTKLITSGGVNTAINALNDKIIHFGTETDYPLSAAHTAYPMGVTLIYTAANTSYPYGTGTVVTIRSANARCVQFSFGNSPDNYKLRTADSSGWSDWKSLKDVPGITDLQKAIGIVVDGDKAATNVTLDQFVILKNSTISSMADGLYTAAKPIPANTAIDKTYLTAVTGGGLNALRSVFTRVTRTYENVTIPSSGSIQVDSYGDMNIDTSKYLISITTRGWWGNIAGITFAKSSTGGEIYMIGPSNTTVSRINAEYVFSDF